MSAVSAATRSRSLHMLWAAMPFFAIFSMNVPGAASELTWTRVRDLPDPVGLKGMLAGVTGERIILAGGSNFPDPPSAGGRKTFHRAGWAQPIAAGGRGVWTPLGDILPRPLAEGAAVTTPHGIVSLGGDSGAERVADVFLLAWNSARGTVDLRPLPPLPLAVGSTAAVWYLNRIYIAGGDDGRGGTALGARLDLDAALQDPATARWEPLPPWPGPRRFGAVLAPVEFPNRQTQLVLAGGKIGTPGPPTQRDYLDDAFAFDPSTKAWHVLPPLPRRALLAVALIPSPGRLVIAGGSSGQDIEHIAELGAKYRMPADAMGFDAANGAWTAAGEMPQGVAGAAVVRLPGGAHLVAGGEYAPTRRTRAVFCVEPTR